VLRAFFTWRLALLFLGVTRAIPAQAPATTVRLTPQLIPSGAMRRHTAQLSVTVDTNRPLAEAKLNVTVPPGFTVATIGSGAAESFTQSVAITLGDVNSSVVTTIAILGDPEKLDRAEYKVQIILDYKDQPSAPNQHVIQLYPISYIPEVPLSTYFGFGLIGIFLGYWLRLFVKILSSITPPQPLSIATGISLTKGRLTAFVIAHYYAIDLAVTIAIGFLILVSLIKDGNPPDNALSWYSALAMGVGLGLLTNSELLTKLTSRNPQIRSAS
jgi:hypothetical protein